jgi:hypothetical protein
MTEDMWNDSWEFTSDIEWSVWRSVRDSIGISVSDPINAKVKTYELSLKEHR